MSYFRELFDEGPIKFITCATTGVVAWLTSYFAPIWSVILVVCVLILLDAVLETKVTLSNGGKIQSRKLRAVLTKFGSCLMVITCCHLIDTEIIVSVSMHLVEVFAGIASGVELWSMIESLQALDPTGPWRIFSKVIRSKGEKYLDITIEKEDLPKVKELVKEVK